MISSSYLISTSQLLSSGICSSASTVAEGYLNCYCTPLGCHCYICFLHVLFFLEDNHFICLTSILYVRHFVHLFQCDKKVAHVFQCVLEKCKMLFFLFYQVGGGPLVQCNIGQKERAKLLAPVQPGSLSDRGIRQGRSRRNSRRRCRGKAARSTR